MKGGEAPPAHRTPARPRPPGTAPGSHTAAPGEHTAPHRRSVRARRSSEAAGWTAGSRGWGPRVQEGGRPALWAGAGVRRAGRGVLLLGWGVGRPAGSPGTSLQWSDRMRSSRPTTPPGPVCPARKIWGRTGSGAPQHPSVIPRQVCPPESSPQNPHFVLISCWTPSPSGGISAGTPSPPLACPSPETVEGPRTSLPPPTMLPSPASPESGACSGCQLGLGPRRPPAPLGACAAGQGAGGLQGSLSVGTPGGSQPQTHAGSDRR